MSTNVLSQGLTAEQDAELLEYYRADWRRFMQDFLCIETKDRGVIPFVLNKPQHYVYKKIRQAWDSGEPVRAIILKSRQVGMCLDPDTRVLTADLAWKRIDDLSCGDEVVSCDEEPPGGRGSGRFMSTATVLAKRQVHDERIRIVLDDGTVIVATHGHRLLSKIRGGKGTKWRECSSLVVGDDLRYVCGVWGDSDYEDGWMGGLIDGEGSFALPSRAGVSLAISQVDGPVLNRTEKYLKERSMPYRIEADLREPGESSKLGGKVVFKIVISRMSELFRIMGKTRPSRFSGRRWWEGKNLPGKKIGNAWRKIVSLERIGTGRMVDLQTSTKTFLANGIVSHNSTLIEAMLFTTACLYPGTKALIAADREPSSRHLYGMTELFYDRMPSWIKPLRRFRTRNQLLLENPDDHTRGENPGLRSHIHVATAKNPDVGAGLTLQLCHLSEFARWKYPEEALGSILHATSKLAHSLVVIESSPVGAGGHFYKLWMLATSGKSGWIPIFIPFQANPEYEMDLDEGEEEEIMNHLRPDEEDLLEEFPAISARKLKWRRHIMATDCGNSVLRFNLEYPPSAERAFFAGGDTYFDIAAIHYYAERTKDGIRGSLFRNRRGKVEFTKDQDGPLVIYRTPAFGVDYTIGVDIAMGVENDEKSDEAIKMEEKGDYSTAVVISNEREQVAELRGRINPAELASYVCMLGQYYNTAMVYPEVLHGGMGFLHKFKQIYPRIGRWEVFDAESRRYTRALGFVPTTRSVPVMLTIMQNELRFGAGLVDPALYVECWNSQAVGQKKKVAPAHKLKLYSRDLIRELNTFVMDDKGKPGAPKGSHDDLVVACGLAIMALDQIPGPQPKTNFQALEKQREYDEYVEKMGIGGDSFNPQWYLA